MLYCSVLENVGVCWSVLERVTACHNAALHIYSNEIQSQRIVVECVGVFWSVLPSVVVCWSVFEHVEVCWSVLEYVAVCWGMQHQELRGKTQIDGEEKKVRKREKEGKRRRKEGTLR